MNKKKLLFIAKILAVFIIPSMYTITYLSANIDPYGAMSEVPVAIVNLDEGISVSGEDINIGDEVAQGMVEDNGFDFQIINEADFSYDDYFMKITIPNNFSKSIINFADNGFEQAKITMSVDESKNYIFSSIAYEALYEMQSEINNDIVEQYVVGGVQVSNYFLDYINQISVDLSDQIILINSDVDEMQIQVDNKLNEIVNYDYQGDMETVKSFISSKLDEINQYIESQILKIETDIDDLFNQILEQLNNVNTSNALENAIKINLINEITNAEEQFNNKLNGFNNQIADKIAQWKTQIVNYESDDVEDFKNIIISRVNQTLEAIDNINISVDAFQNTVINSEYLYVQLDPLTNIEKMATFFAQPAVIETNRENTVENYGYGLAPYFVSLSLFVGAIILMTVFEFKELVKVKYFQNTKNILLFYLMFPLMQVIVMFGLLNIINHFNFIHPLIFIGYSWLVAIAFTTLIVLLVLALEDIGKFIAFTLLVLQLGASAGTFPIEASPMFFQIIHPFLPMTYTIDQYRMIFFVQDITFSSSLIIIIAFIIIAIIAIWKILKYKLNKYNQTIVE